MEAALNQTPFLTQAQALLGKSNSEHITQQNAEVGQSRDARPIKLYLANVGADGVSVAVRICK